MLTLKSSIDFQRVRHKGRSWSHPLVVLIACRNDQKETRLGVAAGKSVGNAIARNRAKRRLRAAVQNQQKNVGIASGWDIVLIARAPVVSAQWNDVKEALNKMMLKAKVTATLSSQ